MLELLLVWGLCKWLGSILRNKGRGTIGLQVALVCFFVGGEIGGLILGSWQEDTGTAYAFGLAGAVLGAGLILLIAVLLPAGKLMQPTYSMRIYGPVEQEPIGPPPDPNNPFAPPRHLE